MAIIAYTNHGKTAVHIGGKLIRPGDTREVDERLLPGAGKPTAQEQPPEDPLTELLKGNVAEVTAGMEALSDGELVRLEMLETDMLKPRKSVLEAINQLQLARAAKTLD